MTIPSDAWKVSLFSVLHTLGANMPGAQDLVEKLIQAVRDEEWALHEAKENCRWDGPPSQQDDSIPCTRCPCDGTRYCP